MTLRAALRNLPSLFIDVAQIFLDLAGAILGALFLLLREQPRQLVWRARDLHPPQRTLQVESESKKKGGASLRPPFPARRPRDASRGRKTPFMSATSYPPTGFPRSTFGDGGLNCRVRNGIG